MIAFLRSLFGMNGSSTTRKVVGQRPAFDVKDVEHVKESEAMLTALYHLAKSYAGTSHEAKIKQVYEKTKNIHHYLVARNRVHELTLFHIRNTQHFITTFRAIIEAHQKPVNSGSSPQEEEPKVQPKSATEKGKQEKEERTRKQVTFHDMAEVLENLLVSRTAGQFNGRSRVSPNFTVHKSSVPEVTIPEISVNTYEKVQYLKLETSDGILIKEIGFISSPKEKESFLQYISDSLGLRDISYVGNALVKMPEGSMPGSRNFVPVIHWAGFLYAVDFTDLRLFPVKMYRKSS